MAQDYREDRPPADLAHVRWLGGSACAGKTTVARLLAERDGIPVYSFDDRFPEHRRRADPVRHPGFVALMDRPPEELWNRPAAELAAELLAFHRDQFRLALDDLAAFPGPVLAEGVGVLPALVPKGAAGAWLLASPAFRREAHPRRGDWVGALLAQSPDPAATHERWMERDDLVAEAIRAEAERRGFPWVLVDGRRSVDGIAAEVAKGWGIAGD
jgi:hypothetical protein